MRISQRLAVVAFLLAGMGAAIAQTAIPRVGACFYRDTNYRGPYFCAQPGESLENLPPGFNDAIRSVRIYGNAQVTVFNDGRFANASTVLSNDVPDLRSLRMANDPSRNWTERISSLQVARDERYSGWNYGWGNAQSGTDTGACFYDTANFRGRSFCVDRGQALNNLPPGFNDRIQSIRVFNGAEVQIFNDNNFAGAAARTRRDIPNLGAWKIPDDPSRNWGGRISSLRVGEPGRGRWQNRGGYRDDDWSGSEIRNLIRCNSQPGDRPNFCSAPGSAREAYMINSYGTCRKNVSWGIDNGRLWVSNGCSADFQINQ